MIEENIIGERFGKLVVIAFMYKDKNGNKCFGCECDCGKSTIKRAAHLNSGDAKSCGCNKGRRSHGDAAASSEFRHLYHTYRNMIERCRNPKHASYRFYGGKGIRVCHEWRENYLNFKNWATKNGYKKNLSIERKDSAKDYQPGNCEWITLEENCRRAARQPRKKRN